MKLSTLPGDITTRIENRKKNRNRYLKPRNPTSSHLWGRTFLRNMLKPPFQRSSEIVPTGHIQEQKDLLRSNETAITVRKMTRPAGWIGLISPLNSHPLRLTSADIGRNPSIPSGRGRYGAAPPLRIAITKR